MKEGRRLKIIKIIILAIISFAVSGAFFEFNTWVMLILFCFLNMIKIPSKSNVADWKKQKRYYVCLSICIAGGILLVVGKEFIKSDFVIILGAIMFSSTFAPIVVKDFVEYCRNYKV